ncbi:hypothetical protein DP73_04640 [Desulfosporosinus sp. HMP52]|uniref:hypothetical protein n=1 Tax=Desulfosporosinus sp. HMP52 TaxID=1487923 RepID=UPI00051F8DA4|nr:hypothetical protein [Desulfosporosinus sp. HMP52]KGK91256.1 hypothetical protein DP73_04640 [Desulfosporosinus sp. HMP52]
MGFAILVLFCILTSYKIINNKNPVAIVLFYCAIAPSVKLGGATFDSNYLYITLITIMIFLKRRSIKKYNALKPFSLMTMIWIVMYFIGWLSHGAPNSNEFWISVVGLLKNIITIYVCYLLSIDSNSQQLDRTMGKALGYIVVANAIMVTLQWLMPLKMFALCNELYYSADRAGYTSAASINTWGGGFYIDHYYRYFGLFGTPMEFSCVLILVLAFLLIQIITGKFYFKHPKLLTIVTIVLGIATQTKLFFLMLPILLIMYVMYSKKKLNTTRIISYFSLGIVCLFFIVFLDKISNIQMFSYFQYLRDPLSAFASRLGNDSSEQGYIYQTLTVGLDNILTGVGPVSVYGEKIADSSYVVLLHNGGILTLLVMLFYYGSLFVKNSKNHLPVLNILLITLFVLGASRNVLLSGSILIITVYYIIQSNRMQTSNKLYK